MFQRVFEFLRNCGVFYIATVEGDLPHVRPFGVVIAHDGKLYFVTGNGKNVSNQMKANPNVEISATSVSCADWIRLRGKAVFENNLDVKKEAFAFMPSLSKIYQTPDNPTFEVFYLTEAEGEFWSMTAAPEKFNLRNEQN